MLALFQTCGLTNAATTGTISGTVTDTSGKIVPGARLKAKSAAAEYRSLSAGDGRFTIVGVELNTYDIVVEAAGYAPTIIRGVTVTADENARVEARVGRISAVIGRTRSRSVASAFNTDQLTVRTTVTSDGIDRLLGKSFEVDGGKLLTKLPGVTIDRNGTPLVRGGFNFQTSFQFESIDYTEPNASLANRFQNFGNGNLLNGVGSIEILPGSGDAVHGNTGTGLIALTSKRGTLPAFGTLDFEFSATQLPLHQTGLEYGWANPNRRFSNYFSYIANDTTYAYGPLGTDPAAIGADPASIDPNNQTLWLSSGQFGAAGGSGSPTRLFSTAYLNKAQQNSRDFIDNLVVRFGRENSQSLQLFAQSQATHIDLDAGGFSKLTAVPQTIFWAGNPFVNPTLSPANLDSFSFIFGPGDVTSQDFIQTHVPTAVRAPGVQNGVPLGGPETIDSPFSAFKLEYSWIPNATTSIAARFTSTRNEQSSFLPVAGIIVPKSGGTRSGVALDLTKVLKNNQLAFGGSFSFARPYGERQNLIDYTGAYEGAYVNPGDRFVPIGPNGAYAHDVIADFVLPVPASYAADGSTLISGTPGCAGAGGVVDASSPPQNCGYLAQFFTKGTPALPAEIEVPKATQQVYALYVQDQVRFNARFRALLGLRLDGYNFLIPDDVQNPPAVDGLRHQRLYEPKIGLNYAATRRDIIRVNYGRSLSIPLPSFIGTDIDRSAFAAFANIPSYDNTTGKTAIYCGAGQPYSTFGQTFFVGRKPCANYADQLYWLMRNARFQNQSQITYPLRGATFSNYDISWAHEFGDGTAFRLTPFYRRGFDVVEQTRDLLGIDYVTGASILSPPVYSNLGTQSAAGIELNVTTRQPEAGLSGQLTATYVNQIGNDSATPYLPTASVLLGQKFRSPNLSPFQSTLALTYRSRSGVRINPVVTYRYGFPYGAGVNAAFNYNGAPTLAPFSNALYPNVFGNVNSTCFVNPQSPGLIFAPNCAALRGAEGVNTSAGTLRSAASLQTDLTIEFGSPNRSGLRYGFSMTNLFNQTANYPAYNLINDCVVVSTGLCASDQSKANGGTSSTIADTTHGRPLAVGPTSAPYIIYPNLPPQQIRAYVQARF
ncbi:MAG: hypothetical protein NVSMB64_27090 [Candidatus Velthaea sp.]